MDLFYNAQLIDLFKHYLDSTVKSTNAGARWLITGLYDCCRSQALNLALSEDASLWPGVGKNSGKT